MCISCPCHKAYFCFIPIIPSPISFFSSAGVSRPLEIVFVVDVSQGITKEMLEKMTNYIREQLDIYNISSSGTHVALIAYGDNSQILLRLRNGFTDSAVISALNRLKKIGGTRRLDVALKRVKNEVFNTFGDARDNAGKLAVVFVTGANSPTGSAELSREGKALRDAGVKVTVIGVGPTVTTEELEEVATDPESVSKVMSVDNLSEATSVVSDNAGRATGMITLIYSS